MAYASKLGRARISSRNPRAAGVCDRCGFVFNHINLRWQFDWRGASLQNLRFLVCNRCMDTPQNQLRAITLPADPSPVQNIRVQDYQNSETDELTIVAPTVYDPRTGIPIPSTTALITQDGVNVTTQPIGIPVGLAQGAVMPLQENIKYGTVLPVLSVIANGTSTLTVTCSAPHGLITNGQISAAGLLNNSANGFYSVTVTTATAFTYQVNSAIPTSSLLQGTSRIITAIVGVPYNYTKIPLTGV
jgi:hypothetical protein